MERLRNAPPYLVDFSPQEAAYLPNQPTYVIDQARQAEAFEHTIDLTSFPLRREVPSPRKRELSLLALGNKLQTGIHELYHSIVALEKGVRVRLVSVIRQGISLGRTILEDCVSWNKLRDILGAGSVATPFGPARGDGMDRHIIGMIDITQQRNYGDSWGLAQTNAQSTIANSGWTVDEIERAANILIFMGTTDNVEGVLARAREELRIEQRYNQEETKRIWDELDGLHQEMDKETQLPEKYTAIENFGDKDIFGIRFVDGEKEEVHLFCKRCQNYDRHHEWCELAKTKSGVSELTIKEPKPKEDTQQ